MEESDDQAGFAASWGEHLESGEPFYRLDRRRSDRAGDPRGASGGKAPERGRLHLRSGPHVGPEAGDPDALDRPRRDGPDVDPRLPFLEAERTPLRRPPGAQQEGDGRKIRDGAGAYLAAELRHPAPRARRDGRTFPGTGSPVRGPEAGGGAADRIAQDHAREGASLLA